MADGLHRPIIMDERLLPAKPSSSPQPLAPSCYSGYRAAVEENFVEIPTVIIPNHAPATNSNLLICKSFIYLGQSGPIEACSDAAIPTEHYPVASEHGAYLLALRGRMLAIGHVFA